MSSAAAAPAEGEPTVIPISQPVSREITDYVEFTGRVNAIQPVNIIPRVTANTNAAMGGPTANKISSAEAELHRAMVVIPRRDDAWRIQTKWQLGSQR